MGVRNGAHELKISRRERQENDVEDDGHRARCYGQVSEPVYKEDNIANQLIAQFM